MKSSTRINWYGYQYKLRVQLAKGTILYHITCLILFVKILEFTIRIINIIIQFMYLQPQWTTPYSLLNFLFSYYCVDCYNYHCFMYWVRLLIIIFYYYLYKNRYYFITNLKILVIISTSLKLIKCTNKFNKWPKARMVEIKNFTKTSMIQDDHRISRFWKEC